MRWINKFALPSILLLVILSGCSAQEQEKESAAAVKAEKNSQAAEENKHQAKSKVEDVENLELYESKDIEDVLQQPIGKYGGEQYDKDKILEAIEKLPKDLTANEYFIRLIALAGDSYRDYYNYLVDYDTSYREATAAPGEEGSQPTVGEKRANVQILLDASGSMKATVNGTPKMDLAKEAIQTFLGEMPEGVNVSLRVYGHKGTGSDGDKAMSCASTEEIYPLGAYEKAQFSEALNQFGPSGWTPLAASIAAAQEDLKSQTEENIENIIYVVSDGVETCGGNPVEVAKTLHESDIKAVINIIGFDVGEAAGQQALKQVADAGGGTYATVNTKKALDDYFRKEKSALLEEWRTWQSVNVDYYFQSQNERVKELFANQEEMIEMERVEEERLLELANIIAEKHEVDAYDIRSAIRDRGYNIRRYARDKAYEHREELRKKGYENRENVRDKGYEEREKIRGQ